MRTLGEVIKSLRLEKHLSQEQFAKLFNVASSTVGMWENNKRSPNEETKEAIADYFNVDMNYLYGKTPIRNSYRDGNMDDWNEEDHIKKSQWGDDEANRKYLADKPELLEIYNSLITRDDMVLLFDKTKDLDPKDVESVLMFVQTIRKQRGFED